MQAKNTPITIACPLHPSEFVQRVNMEQECSQQLYCLECILQCTESGSLPTTLRTINDLVNQTADIYARRKDNVKISAEVPDEFTSLLVNQNERLEELSKHIEDQKKQVVSTFDQLAQTLLNTLDNKKNEYLSELDKQLFNLRYWYIYLDKQIKKTYPSAEDVGFLFPSKEELHAKLQKLTNITQLTALVRNLKEDLAETRSMRPASTISEDARRVQLQTLGRKLAGVESARPFYEADEGYDLSEMKKELKECLDENLSKLLVLQKGVEDISSQTGDAYDSKLLNNTQFSMVKGWLPKKNITPKLLYRGTRDGMSASSFHSKCNNKGATITFLKVKFNDNNTPCLIGGYMDQDWSAGTYISTAESFIFSVTKKIKSSKPNYTQYGGFCDASRGPTWGGGHDISVFFDDNSNYSNPHTYPETTQIAGPDQNNPGGNRKFKLLEIEVYKV